MRHPYPYLKSERWPNIKSRLESAQEAFRQAHEEATSVWARQLECQGHFLFGKTTMLVVVAFMASSANSGAPQKMELQVQLDSIFLGA